MKWSKKDEAKWAKKRMDQSNGHSQNNIELEQEQAWQRTKKKLEDPKLMAVLKRMKDR
jgi:hypothetical protein